MHPGLARIGSSSEAPLQVENIQRHALQLLCVELIRFVRLRTFFLAALDQELSHVSRALQSIVQVDPFAAFVVLLQVVHHCILDNVGRVAVLIVSINISLMAGERGMGSVLAMVFPMKA